MKNLFATASYSFNNFYNSLNTRGQMIFSVIMFLIGILCILLLVTYVIQGLQNKAKINKLKKETKKVNEKIIEKADETSKEPLYNNEKTEIEDIASAISDALMEESPISLTNFEEDQERTAIISIDELMQKAKELELIDDEESEGVNYLEKYNLEPSEVEELIPLKENKNEVKAFRVSQVISPIYGVKKEVINNDNK